MGFFNSKRSSEDEAKRQSAERIEKMRLDAAAAGQEAAGRNALSLQQEQDRGARTREMIQASSGENRQFYNTPLQKGQESVDVIRGTDRTEERFKQMAGGAWVPVPKTSVMELKQATDQQRVDQGYTLGKDRDDIDRIQATDQGKYWGSMTDIHKEENRLKGLEIQDRIDHPENYRAGIGEDKEPKITKIPDKNGVDMPHVWNPKTKTLEPVTIGGGAAQRSLNDVMGGSYIPEIATPTVGPTAQAAQRQPARPIVTPKKSQEPEAAAPPPPKAESLVGSDGNIYELGQNGRPKRVMVKQEPEVKYGNRTYPNPDYKKYIEMVNAASQNLYNR